MAKKEIQTDPNYNYKKSHARFCVVCEAVFHSGSYQEYRCSGVGNKKHDETPTIPMFIRLPTPELTLVTRADLHELATNGGGSKGVMTKLNARFDVWEKLKDPSVTVWDSKVFDHMYSEQVVKDIQKLVDP